MNYCHVNIVFIPNFAGYDLENPFVLTVRVNNNNFLEPHLYH